MLVYAKEREKKETPEEPKLLSRILCICVCVAEFSSIKRTEKASDTEIEGRAPHSLALSGPYVLVILRLHCGLGSGEDLLIASPNLAS